MNPYHTLTDDQLAEWHQLTVKVERLTADLAESRKATESVQRAAEEAYLKFLTDLRSKAQELKELTKRHIYQRDCAQKNAAALVSALAALKQLRDLATDGKISNKKTEWPGEVFRAIEDADEVIRASDIPF